jgi:hypothetical protein
MTARDFSQVKRDLGEELRAEALAGRGALPRDRSGRVPAAFLEETRAKGKPTPLGELLAGLGPELERMANLATLAESTGRVERLERLELELERLLSKSAPRVWSQIRAPLWRLLKQARRELRAADNAGEGRE